MSLQTLAMASEDSDPLSSVFRSNRSLHISSSGKHNVLLSPDPLQALPIHVPDPTVSQLLRFCQEPTSDCGQTRRWLLAAMFPGCGSCHHRAACALAAPRGSAACRARGPLARRDVGAATARGNRLALRLLPPRVSRWCGFTGETGGRPGPGHKGFASWKLRAVPEG
ncbi:uncharacterized protein J5F26_003923 isoform 1-T4 [Ciconia maguari]